MIRTGISAGRSAVAVENKLPQLGGNGVKWLNKGIYSLVECGCSAGSTVYFCNETACYCGMLLSVSLPLSVGESITKSSIATTATILTTVVLENGEIRGGGKAS